MSTETSPLLKSQQPPDSATPVHNGHRDDQVEPDRPDEEVVARPIDDEKLKNVYTVLPVLFGGILIANMDETLVFASASTIASEFDALGRSSWLLVSYSIAVCATQPIYGRFSDVFGRKTTLLVAYVFFIVGSLISGVGKALWLVLLGRTIAGVGGAGMASLVSVILADTLPKRSLATWRSFVTVAVVIGRSLGGPIGGLITEQLSWRWSFLIMCPITALAAILVALRLPSNLQPRNKKIVAREGSTKVSQLSQVDLPGAVLLASTITCMLLLLNLGGSTLRWDSPTIIALAVATIVLGVAFAFAEKNRPHDAIFPLRLFKNGDIITSYLVSGFQMAAYAGLLFFMPLYFQITSNLSVSAAGDRLLAPVIGNALGSILSGYYIRRSGRYRIPIVLGTAVSLLSFILILLRWRGHTNVWELSYTVLTGIGLGIVFAANFVHLAAGVEVADLAVAGTGLFTCQSIFLSAGISVMGIILQATVRSELSKSLAGMPNKDSIIERSLEEIDYVLKFSGGLKGTIVAAYIKAIMWTHVVSLCLAAGSFLVSLFITEHTLE